MANQQKKGTSTQDKKSTQKAPRSAGSQPKPPVQKKPSAPPPSYEPRPAPKREAPPPNPDSLIHQFMPIIFGVIALLFVVFLAVSPQDAGAVGGFIRNSAYGLFGYGAWLIPVFLVVYAILWKKTVEERNYRSLFGFSFSSMIVLCALLHAIIVSDTQLIFNPAELFSGVDGKMSVGGAVGGFVSNILMSSIQKVATYILLTFSAVILLMFTFRLSPHTVSLFVKYRRAVSRDRSIERRARREEEYRRKMEEYEQRKSREQDELQRSVSAVPPMPIRDKKPKKQKSKRDIFLDDDDMPDGYESGSDNYPDEPYPDEYDSSVDDDNGEYDDSYEQVTDYDGDDYPSDDIVINMYADPSRDRADEDDGYDGEDDSDDTLDPIIDDKTDLLPIDDIDLRNVLIPPEQADVLPEITVDDEDVEGIIRRRTDIDDTDAGQDGILPVEEGTDDDEPPFDVSSDDSVTLEPEPLEVSCEDIFSSAVDPEPEPVVKKVYRFPPISILAKAAPVNDSGAQEELAQNARKLVDTLLSFKVKTKILSISRGPTITRYELSPEAGTRVRSIANLVDDIALNLATSGVRIEAPIPGKSAVGIEVPNKTVSTVRLRELIDTPAFEGAESKINVALGVDVAGSPVYCNLAKMPHMLIAGATGMGKSVCINSIISSILYKATPDEVKLILVDPKKVEFNIYNGLPHLLVPVVSDPQKAAGALNWAVGEMERRFSMIDEVGVRDIGGYNAVTANDPDREPMPYVVIIIDELADLMMTAKDTVETSICRLAQKARAAGMHLVIGTQRPSVDVITGLIKANIPSRIAFTVASQVDSKTIIDIGGAEKLIGRGDMLYAPVGLMKPLRVQGAFVSDEEVRAVTDFIRSEGGFIEYDPDIIYSIEREAERCAQSSKGAAAELDDDELHENVDPKFREALEVAVNTGKISTSLLQRHLSIGYGRAAKIIDRMQALGYVSPPDGTKPRDVLITKQMYMEMVVNGDDI